MQFGQKASCKLDRPGHDRMHCSCDEVGVISDSMATKKSSADESDRCRCCSENHSILSRTRSRQNSPQPFQQSTTSCNPPSKENRK